jgi:hypothetical protein|tara:strand:+ start:889 stop:1311 length:423 start_codon:yes stop_codon:yes gene_type:complete
MAKVLTMVFITIGIMLLFNFAGLNTTTASILKSLSIGSVADLANFQSTSYYGLIVFVMGSLATIAGVVLSFFGRQSLTIPGNFLIATGILTVFIGDLITIVDVANQQSAFLGNLLLIIMAPFIVSFIFALYGWATNPTGD